MLIYIRQWQEKVKPQPNANPLLVILGWLLFGLLLVVGLFVGIIILLFGRLLMLPTMWRRRQQLKEMWKFSKGARAAQRGAQRYAQRQQEYRRNQTDRDVIEGEFKVKRSDQLAGIAAGCIGGPGRGNGRR